MIQQAPIGIKVVKSKVLGFDLLIDDFPFSKIQTSGIGKTNDLSLF